MLGPLLKTKETGFCPTSCIWDCNIYNNKNQVCQLFLQLVITGMLAYKLIFTLRMHELVLEVLLLHLKIINHEIKHEVF